MSKTGWKSAYGSLLALVILAGPALGDGNSVTWDGSGNMTWTQPDATSWGGATYETNDFAIFAGAGQGTVTLSGTITPGSVTVSTGAYTFGGHRDRRPRRPDPLRLRHHRDPQQRTHLRQQYRRRSG